MTIAGAALGALWNGVVASAAFALVVYATIALARPSAATRHALWSIALAVAALVPLARFAVSLARAREILRAVPGAAGAGAIAPIAVVAPHAASLAPHAVSPPAYVAVLAALVPLAILMWLAVAGAKGLALTRTLWALARIRDRATALDPAKASALPAWRAASRRGPRAAIAVCDDIDVPCAAGIWQRTILLPTRVASDEDVHDLDRIVMHEYAHFVRYDDWTNVIERAIAAVLWFNPAVALAVRWIAREREVACDDWVVARMGGARRYAACLFRLAETTRASKRTAFAPGALGQGPQLSKRIEHLLGATGPQRFSRGMAAAIASAALVLVIAQSIGAPALATPAPATSATETAQATTIPAIPTPIPTTSRAVTTPPKPQRKTPTAQYRTPTITRIPEAPAVLSQTHIPPPPPPPTALTPPAPLAPPAPSSASDAEPKIEAASRDLSTAIDTYVSRMVEHATSANAAGTDTRLRAAYAQIGIAQRHMRDAAIAHAHAEAAFGLSQAMRDVAGQIREARLRAGAQATAAEREALKESARTSTSEMRRAMEEMRADLQRERESMHAQMPAAQASATK